VRYAHSEEACFGTRCSTVFAALGVLVGIVAAPPVRGDIISEIGGDVGNFAILYEGTGTATLQNNGSIPGNIGIGNTAGFSASGPGTITGNIDFSAADAGSNQQFSESNTTITGTEYYSQSGVSADITDVNNFSATVGAETGTNLSINLNNNQSQTIMASQGVCSNGNCIFNVTNFQFNNGSTIYIDGDSAGDNVVLNFVGINNPQFGGTVILSGLTADQVVFNIVGNENLQINTNGSTVQGIFIDPEGNVQVSHSVVYGQVFGGGNGNMLVSGAHITAPTPEPASILLLATVAFGAVLAIKRRSRRRTTA
jgi:hypothetical protein